MLPETKYDNRSIALVDPLDLRAAPRVAADLPASLYSTNMAGPIPCRVRDLSVRTYSVRLRELSRRIHREL